MKDPVDILRQYNRWRRGEDVADPDPYEIGVAIDRVIAEVELLRLLAAEKKDVDF